MTSNSKHQSVTINDCTLYQGNCLDVLRTFRLNSVDAIVTDPPYGLKFMGKEWDHGVPGIPFWQRALTIIKPGGYLLAFGGTRTYHRLACAIEDAGWEIKDCVMFLYGTGFPKGKGCLKPSYEPVILARRPGKVLPLGIDECRTPIEGNEREIIDNRSGPSEGASRGIYGKGCGYRASYRFKSHSEGRYPTNVVHDGSEEVMEEFEKYGDHSSYDGTANNRYGRFGNGACYGKANGADKPSAVYGDSGGISRFFYCSKTATSERGTGNNHPTVKPIALMEWLVKLVCSEGGTVLDMFMGSGSTGLACINTKRKFIGIELDPKYYEIARDRVQGYINSSSSTTESVNEYLATKENKEEERVE